MLRLPATVSRILSTCPFTNLGIEDALFNALPPSSRRILLYRNTPSIILGRTQNPFHEADVRHAASTSVALLRRRSGGGTVVHDGGNLNIAFMGPAEEHAPAKNLERVVDLLVSMGFERDRFGGGERGDLTFGGRKISGSAYRFSGGRALHHFTLLVESDLDGLRRCLKSGVRERLRVSGAASVRSEVTNLRDEIAGGVRVDEVAEEIGRGLCGSGEGVEALQEGVKSKAVDDEVRVLKSVDWVYGQTPRFSLRLGETVLFMKKGCVVDSVVKVGRGDDVGYAAGRVDGVVEEVDHELSEALGGRQLCGEDLQIIRDHGDEKQRLLVASLVDLVPAWFVESPNLSIKMGKVRAL